MGMFDEFILKKSIKCPYCKQKKIKVFQTKEFEKLLAQFKEGKKAVYYGRRIETSKEKKKRIKAYKKLHPKMGWFLLDIAGSVRKTKKIIGKIPDGQHKVYGFCEQCEEEITGYALVKKGIFTGIKILKNNYCCDMMGYAMGESKVISWSVLPAINGEIEIDYCPWCKTKLKTGFEK